MPSYFITVVFCLWVLWQAWQGYQKGLWASLFGILGLLVAYVVSFLFAQRFIPIVSAFGFADQYATLASYLIVFIGTQVLVRHVPFIFFKALKDDTYRVAGAGLGAVTGVISGLLIVWFFSLIDNSGAAGAQVRELAKPGEVKNDLSLASVASNFVAKTAEIGLKVSGSDTATSESMAAVIRQPQAVMSGLNELMKSSELRQLVNDPDIQQMLATNDVGSFKNTFQFKQVMQLPAMQRVVNALDSESKSRDKSEAFIAEQMTFLWRRMMYLKSDPRVQEILNDPEVKALAEKDSPLALMANPKFRKLVGIVLDDKVNISNVDFTQSIDSNYLETESANAHLEKIDGRDEVSEFDETEKPYTPMTVYKWVDEHGNTRYSDLENIPQERLSSAEKLVR